MSTISAKGRRWFFVSSLAACLSVALAVGLCLKVRASTEHAAFLFDEVAKGEQRIHSGASLQALARETAPLQDALLRRFISAKGAADFIEKLEATGREIGVTVSIDSVEPRTLTLPQVGEIRIALQGAGRWEEVVRYLALMEELPVESRVISAAFSRAEKEKGSAGTWRVDIVLSALQQQ